MKTLQLSTLKTLGWKSFFTLALVAVTGLSLNSCLGSDADTNKLSADGYFKITSWMGNTIFVRADGQQVIPTVASVSSVEAAQGISMSDYDGQVCYMLYSWDKTQINITNDMTKINGVTFEGFVPLGAKTEVVAQKGAPNDSINDTPIIRLGNENNKPLFFDQTTLLLPVQYYLNNTTHSITLVYNAYEENDTDKPRLYLRHSKRTDSPVNGGTTSEQWANSGYLGLYMFSFNLSGVYEDFMRQGHEMPTGITLVTTENEYSNDISETSGTKTQEYNLEYDPDALKE